MGRRTWGFNAVPAKTLFPPLCPCTKWIAGAARTFALAARQESLDDKGKQGKKEKVKKDIETDRGRWLLGTSIVHALWSLGFFASSLSPYNYVWFKLALSQSDQALSAML